MRLRAGRNRTRRKFKTITFKYFWGDEIKENKIDWACGTYGEEKYAYRVLVGRLDASLYLEM